MTLRAMYVAPLVALGAAFAATGFADQVLPSYNEPAAPQPVTVPADAAMPQAATEEPAPRPVAARPDTSSTTRIYGQRRTEDEFITDDVVKALAAEPRISGKIGVDTYRRVVTLTGRVSTRGQVDRITRAAQRAVNHDVEIHNQVISNV